MYTRKTYIFGKRFLNFLSVNMCTGCLWKCEKGLDRIWYNKMPKVLTLAGLEPTPNYSNLFLVSCLNCHLQIP